MNHWIEFTRLTYLSFSYKQLPGDEIQAATDGFSELLAGHINHITVTIKQYDSREDFEAKVNYKIAL